MEMEEVEQTPSGIRVGDLVRVVRPRSGLYVSRNYLTKRVCKRVESGRIVYYLSLVGEVGQFFDDRFQKVITFTPDKEYKDLYN